MGRGPGKPYSDADITLVSGIVREHYSRVKRKVLLGLIAKALNEKHEVNTHTPRHARYLVSKRVPPSLLEQKRSEGDVRIAGQLNVEVEAAPSEAEALRDGAVLHTPAEIEDEDAASTITVAIGPQTQFVRASNKKRPIDAISISEDEERQVSPVVNRREDPSVANFLAVNVQKEMTTDSNEGSQVERGSEDGIIETVNRPPQVSALQSSPTRMIPPMADALVHQDQPLWPRATSTTSRLHHEQTAAADGFVRNDATRSKGDENIRETDMALAETSSTVVLDLYLQYLLTDDDLSEDEEELSTEDLITQFRKECFEFEEWRRNELLALLKEYETPNLANQLGWIDVQ